MRPIGYILDGHQPMPTDDLDVYLTFQQNPENRRLERGRAGQLITLFPQPDLLAVNDDRPVTINGIPGEGHVVVDESEGIRTCEGRAHFSGQAFATEIRHAFNDGEAEYSGIVYNKGAESTETFRVLITEIEEDEGWSEVVTHVVLKAAGNPYQ